MYIEYIERLLEEANRAIEAREYATAEKMMKNALFDEPDYAKLHNNLGWLYQYCIENERLAEMHLKYAIRFDPDGEAPYLNIADLYLEGRKYTELKRVMEEAVDKTSAHKVLVYSYLGKAYEATFEFSKAVKYYRMALYGTIDGYETNNLKQSIKRCRYKKLRKTFQVL